MSELLPLHLLGRLHPRHRHLDRLDLTQRRLPNGLPNVNLDVCIVERDGIWREAQVNKIIQRVLGIQGQVVRLICALPLRYLHWTWLILMNQDGLVEIVYTASLLVWEQGSLFVHMSAALAGYPHVVASIIHCGAIIAPIDGVGLHETSVSWEQGVGRHYIKILDLIAERAPVLCDLIFHVIVAHAHAHAHAGKRCHILHVHASIHLI